MKIRRETPEDGAHIGRLINAAFASIEHASGQEATIVEKLRSHGQMTISLVSEDDGIIVGHVAFSPVFISDGSKDWHGLGPVAVLPAYQGRGIGKMLIEKGLENLRIIGGRGCVVLGDPAYYRRFGFACEPHLELPGVPQEYFQALAFAGRPCPHGLVTYAEAFNG
jgi:putative acetyltransferase